MARSNHTHQAVQSQARRGSGSGDPGRRENYGAGLQGRYRRFLPAILVLATLAAFIPSLGNGFVNWDDPKYLYENPLLKDFSFRIAFSTEQPFMGNYHPLTLLWLHWEYLLFPAGNPQLYDGLNPFWFHLNSLILHLLNTFLVYKVILALVGREGWKIAGIAALVFGIHPMHVESVAWVSELKDVLYTAFFLGSAWAYLEYFRSRKFLLLALSFVLFVFSCLAKGQAVTLPLLLLLFDWYRGRRFDVKTIIEKVPFFIVSLVFGILAILSQEKGNTVLGTAGILNNVAFAGYGVLFYIYKFIVPGGLSGVYPYPADPSLPVPAYYYIFPVIALLIPAGLLLTKKYSKDYLFGVLFFLLSVSVTLRFISLGDSITADRYTYIPYIGLGFICGSLLTSISARKRMTVPLTAAGAVIFLLLGILTWNRTGVWKDTYTFWGDVAEKQPAYWRGYTCMGQEYREAGDYGQALDMFNLAIEKDPHAPVDPYMNRGSLYVDQLGRVDDGIADFRKVISFPGKEHPSQFEARRNLGLAYIKKGTFDSAVQVLDAALKLNGRQPETHYMKGLALAGMNDYPGAAAAYTRAVTLSPGYAEAWLRRGILYTDRLNDPDRGIADFRKVLELKPGDKNATVNLGICYLKKNMPAEAATTLTTVIGKDPGDGMLYLLRAQAFRAQGEYEKARQDLSSAKECGIAVADTTMQNISRLARIKRN